MPCSLVMTVNSNSFWPSFRLSLCSSAEVSLMDLISFLAVGGSANVVGAMLLVQNQCSVNT